MPLQIHPNKSLAAKLHEEGPEKFPDSNHKPEIAVALSRFELFAGWKEPNQISALYEIPSLRRIVSEKSRPMDRISRHLVRAILKADGQIVRNIQEDLKQQSRESLESLGFPSCTFELIERLQSQFSAEEPGILVAILCMNYLVLDPGEAIFIPADGVHCYVSGDILECMARSNNMLGGGLCPIADRDNIDIFSDALRIDLGMRLQSLKLPLKTSEDGPSRYTQVYSPPIDEFDVLRIDLPTGKEELIWYHRGPATAIAISGSGTIHGDGKEHAVESGFIFFMAAETRAMLRAESDLLVYVAVVR